MIANIQRNSIISEKIAYWISMLFLGLMSLFFILDEAAVLFEYKFISVTTTGILGVISVFSFGWYAFKKGQPTIASGKHILFTLIFTIITIMLYLGTFTILKIFFR